MNMTYRWYSNVPGDDLNIQIALFEEGQRIFDAVLSLASDHSLLAAHAGQSLPTRL